MSCEAPLLKPDREYIKPETVNLPESPSRFSIPAGIVYRGTDPDYHLRSSEKPLLPENNNFGNSTGL